MQINKRLWFLWLFLLACPVQMARADLGFWSAHLVGTWRHPTNGDIYRFRSNATYSFFVGKAKRRGGNLSHSGYWKIVQPTSKESGGSMEGPVALRLDSKSRTVLEGKKSRVLKSNRRFRVLVDIVQKSEDGLVDKNHYIINGARWIRVR
ncbi:hypothetical protein B1R32_102160 [Abditibacterium utsteinense]|uniref:DUF2147 domain-containing protein n=1 Tax=Abditibacterium utsteinense TaxID=1960156 RepID=A0A2S8SWI4_9BACT|nr:hypothetical protein [Abditibacterium utsteinense]PQV65152.1 hypothetical protein B1R32_102160 [Abditibacterium utsteinense]